MLVRQAHEIEWVKKGPNALSPKHYSAKLNLEFVKYGYVLVGFIDVWSGAKTKFRAKCSHGHVFDMRIDNFLNQNNRCPRCSGAGVVSKDERISQIERICKDEDITFIDFVGPWKGKDSKIRLKCNNGHEWGVTIHNFVNHGRRCPGCKGERISKSQTVPMDDRMQQIKLICNKENITFLGFDDDWKGIKTKIKLKCEHSHIWVTTIESYVNLGSRCPTCAGVRAISKDERLTQIHQICESEDITFIDFVGPWKGKDSKIRLKCNNGHEWVVRIHNFVYQGNRCPSCPHHGGGYKPSKQGTLYIQMLYRNKSFIGAKFGITNVSSKKRMSTQRAKSKFDHEIFYELTLQDGQKILELENKIKEAMKGKTSYISKEDMPDGYTETVAPSELSTIMYIVKTFEKELTA